MKLLYDIYSKTNRYIIDGVTGAASLLLAYQLRFEGQVPEAHWLQMWVLLPIVVATRLAVNASFRVYRQNWRHIGIADSLRILQSYTVISAVLLVLRLGLPASLGLLRVPLSIIAMEFLFSLYGAVGVRILRRVLYQWELRRGSSLGKKKRLLLVGAGSAGVIAAKELSLRPDIEIVGFVEDFPKIHGSRIAGFPILGSTGRITELVRKHGVDEVVLCLARAPVATLKRLWRLCEGTPARTLIIPTLHEIFDREVGISRLREIKIEDLLSRETVELPSATPEISATFRDKRILVTGAAGSIGSELVRQLADFEPACLFLLDKDENMLFERELELKARIPRVAFKILVADIRFEQRLRKIFDQYHPEVVFHAAAYKQVPLMEVNPSEAILNNVFGTCNLAQLAIEYEVERLVFISTDKAVKPASIMGASKRLGELVIQAEADRYKASFCCVRFGNVMASRSSVIPLFQTQIAAGGPVTLTHPEMQRFFMTIPEAAQLVIQAGTLAENGSTYVLDMGDPVRVGDLARDLIELSGLRPNQDIQIDIVGLRPGEKLTEELVGDGESLEPTRVPRIFAVTSNGSLDVKRFEVLLRCLRKASEQDDVAGIRLLLRDLSIGYDPAPPKETHKPLAK